MINVAILGAGIGREHLVAYRALLDEFQVSYLVDLDQERIAEIRELGDGFQSTSRIEDVLQDPAVDLIDICLPPHLHVDIALQALAAGKHVVCEKPLATSLADIDRLTLAVAKFGTQLFPVFQYRWGPSLAQLRALVAAGLAGQGQVASVETHWSRGADYYAVPWRGTWDGENGGAVLGHAIHNHDLLCQFMGPVEALSAMVDTRINSIETEDCAALGFRHRSGALSVSSITLGAARDETRIRLVFEHLTATSGSAPYAPGLDDWTFTARDPANQDKVDQVVTKTPHEPVGFAGFFQTIADNLNNRPNQAVTLAEGRASIELVTGIYQAARLGMQVHLPLSESHPLYQGWMP